MLARKPLAEPTVAANVLAHGTGALNVAACRAPTGESLNGGAYAAQGTPRDDGWGMQRAGAGDYQQPAGRWPSNVLLAHVGGPDGCQPAGVRRVRTAYSQPTRGTLDGSLFNPGDQHHGQPVGYADPDGYEQVDAWACHPQCPIRLLDEQAGPRTSGAKALHHVRTTTKGRTTWGSGQGGGILHSPPEEYPASTGHCSRFFPTFPGPDAEDAVPFRYQPKAPARERRLADGTPTGHPTQKPAALAEWLASLVCAPGGTILDPFAGVGSLGIGALRAGCHYLGIEQDAGYAAIAQRRLDEEQEQHAGPLFAGVSTATTAAR